jgi:hypothetical protein
MATTGPRYPNSRCSNSSNVPARAPGSKLRTSQDALAPASETWSSPNECRKAPGYADQQIEPHLKIPIFAGTHIGAASEESKKRSLERNNITMEQKIMNKIEQTPRQSIRRLGALKKSLCMRADSDEVAR